MILHCYICSRGGSHIGDHSAIATIDQERLSLPISGAMFGSAMPERGLPAPWRTDLGWRDMKCPRGPHLPWDVQTDEVPQAIEQGGPMRLHTSEGVIDMRVSASEHVCECGYMAKSAAGLAAHKRRCDG